MMFDIRTGASTASSANDGLSVPQRIITPVLTLHAAHAPASTRSSAVAMALSCPVRSISLAALSPFYCSSYNAHERCGPRPFQTPPARSGNMTAIVTDGNAAKRAKLDNRRTWLKLSKYNCDADCSTDHFSSESLLSDCISVLDDDMVNAMDGGTDIAWDERSPRRLVAQNPVYVRQTSIKYLAFMANHPKPSSDKKLRTLPSTIGVTSVVFLQNSHLFASAGSQDQIIRVWDCRRLSTEPIHVYAPTCNPDPSQGHSVRRIYGVTSLAMDPDSTVLAASSRDNSISVYDTTSLQSAPVMSCGGYDNRSFYIKTAINTDQQLVSGSSSGDVHVWKIDQSRWFNYREDIELAASSTFESVLSSPSPLITHLPNHTMYCGDRTKNDAIAGYKFDVMGVACCPTDPCKIASCGDDGRVLLWRYKAGEQ